MSRRREALLALAVPALVGCTPTRSTDFRVELPDVAAFDRTAAIEVIVQRGTCGERGEVVYAHTFARDRTGTVPPRLGAGPYAFEAIARDASCGIVASTCESVALPLPENEALVLRLTAASGTGCPAAECTCGGCSCTADRCDLPCVGADAGMDADGGLDADAGPPAGAVDFAAGSHHSCAILAGGVLSCWGNGRGYALGFDNDGVFPTPDTLVPDPTRGDGALLDGFTRVFAGGRGSDADVTGTAISCGVRADGLWCWGQNWEGQLARPGASGDNLPELVLGLPDGATVVDMGLGSEHTCAALSLGVVSENLWCWGLNDDGQLGDGTRTSRYTPDNVDFAIDIVRVDAGTASTCAVTSGGELWCWGANNQGQAGLGTTSAGHVLPQRVSDWTDVVDVACFADHVCALRAGGRLFCWGDDDNGQVGNGPGFTPVLAPAEIVFPDPVVHAEVGRGFSCAVTDRSEVWCWGGNWAGQVGSMATTSNTPAPIRQPTAFIADPIVDLEIGSAFGCVRSSGTASRVWCWGTNRGGELGRGAVVPDLDPVPAMVGGLLDPG